MVMTYRTRETPIAMVIRGQNRFQLLANLARDELFYPKFYRKSLCKT